MYATPAYVAAPGDIAPDLLRLLHWASLGAEPAGAAVLRRAVLRAAPGARCASAASAWTCRWRWASRSPSSPAPAPPSSPGGLFGHEVYFDSLTMFVFFLLGGRWLELRARHRAAPTRSKRRWRACPTAWSGCAPTAASRRVAVARLRRGRPGARAGRPGLPGRRRAARGPHAGRRGAAHRRVAPGARKQRGDAVVAGSLNLRAPVVMRVLRAGRGHAPGRHRRADAQRADAAAARWCSRPTGWPARSCGRCCALAAGAAAAWSRDRPVARGLGRGVGADRHLPLRAVAGRAVGACSRPPARWRGAACWCSGSRRSRRWPRIDTVVFDKTGTLTATGSNSPRPCCCAPGADARARCWRSAASLAALSTPSRCRARWWRRAGERARRDRLDARSRSTRGRASRPALHDGTRWRLGAPRLGRCRRRRRDVAAARRRACASAPTGTARCRVRVCAKQLRADAAGDARTPARARACAWRCCRATRRQRAAALAPRLGIADVRGGATPGRQARGRCAHGRPRASAWRWSATASTTRRCWRAPTSRSRFAHGVGRGAQRAPTSCCSASAWATSRWRAGRRSAPARDPPEPGLGGRSTTPPACRSRWSAGCRPGRRASAWRSSSLLVVLNALAPVAHRAVRQGLTAWTSSILLIPLSVVLVLAVIGIFAWALQRGPVRRSRARRRAHSRGGDETAGVDALRQTLIAIKPANDPATKQWFQSDT